MSTNENEESNVKPKEDTNSNLDALMDQVMAAGGGGAAIQVGMAHSSKITINSEPNLTDLAQLFEVVRNQIKARPEDLDVDKEEIINEIDRIEKEATKGEAANPSKVERWLGNLANLAPDILEVTVDSLTNPASGVSMAIRKVAKKAKTEAE